jgi:serine/threonine-protein kinase
MSCSSRGLADAASVTGPERELLRERVENLESIVCSVDFELNQKLAKVIDEQRSMILPGAATGALGAGNGGPPRSGTGPSPALDRTATAHAAVRAPPPVTTSLEPGQVLAQRYRVQRLLGKGGMGAVYLADDEVLGELVALKVISSAFASDAPGSGVTAPPFPPLYGTVRMSARFAL